MRSLGALPVSQMACKSSLFHEPWVIDSTEHILTIKARFLLACLLFESLKDKVSAKLIRKTLNELQNDSKRAKACPITPGI